jgi:hypothetical protein
LGLGSRGYGGGYKAHVRCRMVAHAVKMSRRTRREECSGESGKQCMPPECRRASLSSNSTRECFSCAVSSTTPSRVRVAASSSHERGRPQPGATARRRFLMPNSSTATSVGWSGGWRRCCNSPGNGQHGAHRQRPWRQPPPSSIPALSI